MSIKSEHVKLKSKSLFASTNSANKADSEEKSKPEKRLCKPQPAEPGHTASSQSEERATKSPWSNDENPGKTAARMRSFPVKLLEKTYSQHQCCMTKKMKL